MPVQQIQIINNDGLAFSRAYSSYKNSIARQRTVIDFSGVPSISVENSSQLFGRLLINDRLRSVIFKNLPMNTDNIQNLFNGVNRAFADKYPHGVISHGATITSPQIELFDQTGDGVHFTIMLGRDVYEAIER